MGNPMSEPTEKQLLENIETLAEVWEISADNLLTVGSPDWVIFMTRAKELRTVLAGGAIPMPLE